MKTDFLSYKSVLIASFALLILFVAMLAFSQGQGLATVTEAQYIQIQAEPEITVLPDRLERLSWGAVVAGTLITLIVMFILNLVGIAIGFSQVNPEYGQASANTEGLAIGGIAWIAVSNLIALFVGGWLSAYFAGIPEPVDGLLHGLMVWAVSGIITILLVMSGLGRVMNGLAGLINSALNLTGSATAGAGQVAGGAIQTAGHTVGAAGNLTAQALSVLAQGMQSSAQIFGNGLTNLSDSAIENVPDVQNALRYQDLSLDEIRLELEKLVREAGKNPQSLENQANATVNDVRSAAQQVVQHPEHADEILNIVLQRVFRRGEEIASDVDRDALVNVLTERTNMSPEEVNQQVQKWEEQFNTIKQQTGQVREQARQQAESLRDQAEKKAQEIYEQAQQRVANMQQEVETKLQQAAHEAEEKAREVAQDASDTFSKIAAGIAVAMVVGAIAAGLGGYIGAPQDLPTVTVNETTSTFDPNTSVLMVVNDQNPH